MSENLTQKMADEIKKSLLMEDADKKFFLEHVETMTPSMVKGFYEQLSKKNRLVEKYIRLALAEDKGHLYLSELKAKIRQLQSSTQKLSEQGELADLESELLQKISQI